MPLGSESNSRLVRIVRGAQLNNQADSLSLFCSYVVGTFWFWSELKSSGISLLVRESMSRSVRLLGRPLAVRVLIYMFWRLEGSPPIALLLWVAGSSSGARAVKRQSS